MRYTPAPRRLQLISSHERHAGRTVTRRVGFAPRVWRSRRCVALLLPGRRDARGAATPPPLRAAHAAVASDHRRRLGRRRRSCCARGATPSTPPARRRWPWGWSTRTPRASAAAASRSSTWPRRRRSTPSTSASRRPAAIRPELYLRGRQAGARADPAGAAWRSACPARCAAWPSWSPLRQPPFAACVRPAEQLAARAFRPSARLAPVVEQRRPPATDRRERAAFLRAGVHAATSPAAHRGHRSAPGAGAHPAPAARQRARRPSTRGPSPREIVDGGEGRRRA